MSTRPDSPPGARFSPRRAGGSILALLLALAPAAWSGEPTAGPAENLPARQILFKTTLGPLRLALRPEQAPHAARRFLKLCEFGFYDGSLFTCVQRGRRIEAGQAETRPASARPPPAELLAPSPADRPGKNKDIYLVTWADQESRETRFAILMNPSSGGEQAPAFAQVISGMETLQRMESVRVTEQFMPVEPLAILETRVVDPEYQAPPDPAYEQVVEERQARMRDPKFKERPERERYRKPAASETPRGLDPGFVFPLLLSLLGLALMMLAPRLTPRLLSSLGILAFVTGGFAVYVRHLPLAAHDSDLGLLLFLGSGLGFWMLSRWDRA